MRRAAFRPTAVVLQYRPQHTVATDGRVHAQTVLETEAKRKLKMISEEGARFVVEKAERSANGRVIGIDLGTTNSCISYIDKETNVPRIIPSPTGSWVFPTAVTFDRNHNVRTFGEEARACVRTSASATLCSGKRLIGRRFGELGRVQSQLHKTNQLTMTETGEVAVEIMGRTYTIVHITAMFLRYLKLEAEKFLKEPVECVVVSVPAYFTPQQKVATEDAALCAGFDVLEVIDEPSAACLTYTVLNKDNPNMPTKRIHRSLVFDLGGGTLDSAILEHDTKKHTFTLVATHGDPLLGGNDWDTAISQRFMDQFEKKWKIQIEDPNGNVGQGVSSQRNLMLEAEKAKVHFTHSQEPYNGFHRAFHFSEQLRDIVPLEVSMTWEEYLELTHPLRERCRECLDKLFAHSGFDKSDIDNVLLVGAMTRDPPIRMDLEKYFSKPISDEVACPADYAVAIGAAVRGGMLQGHFPHLSSHTRFVSGTVQAQRSGGFISKLWHKMVSLGNVNVNAVGTRWRGTVKGLSDREISDYAKELVEFEAQCNRRKLLEKAEQNANFLMKRVTTDANKRQGNQDRRIKQLTDQLKFWQYMVHNFHDHEEHLDRTVRELEKAMDELEGVNMPDDTENLTDVGTIDIAKAFNKLRGYTPPAGEGKEAADEPDPFAKFVDSAKKMKQSAQDVVLSELKAESKPVPTGPKVLRRAVPLPKGSVDADKVAEVGHPIFVGQDVSISESNRAALYAAHVGERSWCEPPKPPGEEGSWRDVQSAIDVGDIVGAPLDVSRPMSIEDQLEALMTKCPIDDPSSDAHAALRELSVNLGTMTIVDEAPLPKEERARPPRKTQEA